MGVGVTAPPLFPDPAVVALWEGRTIDIEQILDLLPHRPPFLLLDRVTELDPAKHVVGIKCVTMNEWFFVGHYPGHPVMPGVLILEALAQLTGVLAMTGLERGCWVPYFTGIERARFRRIVRPGDVLTLESTLTENKFRFGRLMCRCEMRATVDGQVAADAICSFALANPEE